MDRIVARRDVLHLEALVLREPSLELGDVLIRRQFGSLRRNGSRRRFRFFLVENRIVGFVFFWKKSSAVSAREGERERGREGERERGREGERERGREGESM
jgi:hypothetical protein